MVPGSFQLYENGFYELRVNIVYFLCCLFVIIIGQINNEQNGTAFKKTISIRVLTLDFD